MRVRVAILAGACTLTALLGFTFGPDAQRRNALRRMVDYVCVPNKRWLGHAAPCLDVDLARHYALVRAWFPEELLLVPTTTISGIEDPAVLDPSTPNYWRLAWDERKRLLDEVTPPHGRMIALAVNSAYRRTQDQLHIHIDCLRTYAQAGLKKHKAEIGSSWTTVTFPPDHDYQVMRLPEQGLNGPYPFLLLAQAVGGSRDSMARQTLVLAGNDQGFYLLRQGFQPNLRMSGHGEELLDHRCAETTPHRLHLAK